MLQAQCRPEWKFEPSPRSRTKSFRFSRSWTCPQNHFQPALKVYQIWTTRGSRVQVLCTFHPCSVGGFPAGRLGWYPALGTASLCVLSAFRGGTLMLSVSTSNELKVHQNFIWGGQTDEREGDLRCPGGFKFWRNLKKWNEVKLSEWLWIVESCRIQTGFQMDSLIHR